jgi:hypothetical protein
MMGFEGNREGAKETAKQMQPWSYQWHKCDLYRRT